jgi:hypothetical protein
MGFRRSARKSRAGTAELSFGSTHTGAVLSLGTESGGGSVRTRDAARGDFSLDHSMISKAMSMRMSTNGFPEDALLLKILWAVLAVIWRPLSVHPGGPAKQATAGRRGPAGALGRAPKPAQAYPFCIHLSDGCWGNLSDNSRKSQLIGISRIPAVLLGGGGEARSHDRCR